MSFRSVVEELSAEPLEERLAAATGHDVERALLFFPWGLGLRP